jgi:hypothetical protein
VPGTFIASSCFTDVGKNNPVGFMMQSPTSPALPTCVMIAARHVPAGYSPPGVPIRDVVHDPPD